MPLSISIKRITIGLFAFALACALIASGCSKGGGTGLHVKSAATGEKDLARGLRMQVLRDGLRHFVVIRSEK